MTARRLLQISVSNLGLKSFALFVSALVWFHAATERTYSTEKRVRVEYSGLKDSLFILNELPESFRVRVVGKGKSLINMSLFARPKAVIDMSELKPGKNSMEIDWGVLTIPHGLGVEVEAVQPSDLEFLVDVLSRRKVKVDLVTEGEPKRGFLFREGSVNETVYLYGPSQVIRNHGEVDMKPVNLGKMHSDFEYETSLIPPEENTWLDPSAVTGTINVVPAFYRDFDSVKVEVREPEGLNAMFAPGRVKLSVFGLEEKVQAIRNDEIVVLLDLTEMGEGTHEITPRVVTPDGIRVENMVPQKVTVIISP
jgi:YbbR domain-containing protein